MKEIFEPAWWCRGAHTQTLFGALFRAKSKLKLSRKRLELPDGDFIDLDFLAEPRRNKRRTYPLVVILHGLEGSSGTSYVQSLIGEIYGRRWEAVVINMRMCSGSPNRLKQTYHSGKTEDLACVINYLKEKENRSEIYLVGYSIGGNVLLKWLGEQGGNIPSEIKKAAAISVPYDLAASVELMDRGFNRRVYTRALLASLKSMRVPTLLIHAEDDPFFPGKLFPMDEVRNSEFLTALIVQYGGHLGFIGGRWPWKQDLWLEKKIMEFLITGGKRYEQADIDFELLQR